MVVLSIPMENVVSAWMRVRVFVNEPVVMVTVEVCGVRALFFATEMVMVPLPVPEAGLRVIRATLLRAVQAVRVWLPAGGAGIDDCAVDLDGGRAPFG
jgi:hypothetical protein